MTREDIHNAIQAAMVTYGKANASMTQWRDPLVGFASASDPAFKSLKQAVSPSHFMPSDLLPSARTVIAFFIPFHRSVVQSNIPGATASRIWAVAYIETNVLIQAIGHHLKLCLEADGQEAFASPATHNFNPQTLISDWSHRHVAYIAGLGRFGVNNMLITEKGCSGRFGSVITSIDLKPNTRSNAEFCLYHHNGSCLKCVERCPTDALSATGFDRNVCYSMCLENEKQLASIGKADVCGKCLTAVPCAFSNPVPKL